MTWTDGLAQWLVGAPMAVQMVVLVVVAVPVAVAAAWALMWAIDRVARPKNTGTTTGTKMMHHVDPE